MRAQTASRLTLFTALIAVVAIPTDTRGAAPDPREPEHPIPTSPPVVELSSWAPSMFVVPCGRGGNKIVRVVDEPSQDLVTIDVNGTVYTRSSRRTLGFDVTFCGGNTSNVFEYDLGPWEQTLNVPRTFIVNGGSGFDYVFINLDTNGVANPIEVDVPPEIYVDLGGLSDQVEIDVGHFGPGEMDIHVVLGDGHDGFNLVGRGRPMDGSADIYVDGGAGEDVIYVDLQDAVGFDLPAGERLEIMVSGDARSFGTGAYDNTADHAQDLIQVVFRGIVDGELVARVDGDDGQPRFKDFACLFENACLIFDTSCPNANPCDLEHALRLDPHYAADNIDTRFEAAPGSTGEVSVRVDGGFSTDEVVLMAGSVPLNSLSGFDAELLGGQYYATQWDWCWTDSFAVQAICNGFDPSIVDI